MAKEQACTRQEVDVKLTDLPLSCPPTEDRIWDAHPRVFLPLEETGQLDCPYCGTRYILKK